MSQIFDKLSCETILELYAIINLQYSLRRPNEKHFDIAIGDCFHFL